MQGSGKVCQILSANQKAKLKILPCALFEISLMPHTQFLPSGNDYAELGNSSPMVQIIITL